MSSNLNICDLGSDLILIITDYLPYRDKIKLVDLFPCVRNQITVFDMSSMGDYSIDQKMSLFGKLTNVHKVTGDPDWHYDFLEDFMPLRKLIFSGSNKQISHFLISQSNRPIRDTLISREPGLLTYTENVKKSDPLYDASCIKNIFDIRSENVIQLMEKFPDLTLKFGLEFWSLSDEHSGSVWEPLLKNPSLHDRIVYMKLDGDFIRFIPNEIRHPFESVVKLDLMHIGNQSGEIFTDNLKHILRLTPNVMKLTLVVQMSHLLGDDGEKIADEFISSLFSITKLNQLIVEFRGLSWSWTRTQKDIDTFQNIVNQLLTSNQKLGLKKLCIESDCESWDIVRTVSNVDIRNDFKYLKLHNLENQLFQEVEEKFEIKNHGIRMVNIKPSIQYLFSRFPKIKWIDITTDDGSYRSRVGQEYQSIKNGLPRNRWLQMNVTVQERLGSFHCCKMCITDPDPSDEFEEESVDQEDTNQQQAH